jgi:hypothetical protein
MDMRSVDPKMLGWDPRVDFAVAELDRRRNAALDDLQRMGEQRLANFRARLAAASWSRSEMATVMVEALRALGYDMQAWDRGLSVRHDPQFDSGDLEDARKDGYSSGQSDGPNEDDLVKAHDEGYDEGVKYIRTAIEDALSSL